MIFLPLIEYRAGRGEPDNIHDSDDDIDTCRIAACIRIPAADRSDRRQVHVIAYRES